MTGKPDPGSSELVAAFKDAASHFPTGVTVVTSRLGEMLYGMTVSAFLPLSLDPLLITVSLTTSSPLLRYIRESNSFAVSVLTFDQDDVSRYFATAERGPSYQKFPSIKSEAATTGAPVIADAVAYFDCILFADMPGGDHRLVVGSVVDIAVGSGEPLVYCRRQYAAVDAYSNALS